MDGVGVGRGGSELKMPAPRPSKCACAWRRTSIPSFRTKPSVPARSISKPFWDVERARIGDHARGAVELVVNGRVVATRKIAADGQIRDVEFDVPVGAAAGSPPRVLSSSHTNPVFAIVGDKPIRASRRSADGA